MFPRTALTGLLAVAVAAILPAAATATVAPSLAITQGNGATAGSTATTVLDVTFANKGGDAPKAITVTFPPRFLLNLGQNEGKCLASTAPSPSCLLGSLTYTDAGGEEAGAGLYLVSPPTIGDVAGMGAWRQIADCDRFIHSGSRAATRKVEADLEIPALGCGLWVAGR